MSKIFPLYPPCDRALVRAKECYQYDSEGRTYIDFESGVWCANLGHSHERIARAIAEQAEKNIHHGYKFTSPEAEELSQRLQELAGVENGSAVFLSSGSEAVELSIRVARHLTGRQKVLKIGNSYLSAYGVGRVDKGNQDMIEISADDMDAVDAMEFGEIAAFIMEVGGCSIDMVRVPSEPFIQKIVKACQDSGCFVVAEEVTTGMGRMGYWFGYQHYGIQPDMIVLGKALGNGYPISSLMTNAATLEAFRESGFIYAQSHQNDPMGCGVAMEVTRVLEDEDLLSASKTMGQYFKDELVKLMDKYPGKVHAVRGVGLMLGFEFAKDMDGHAVSDALFEQGFVVGFKSNTLRFLPPLNIGAEEIDKVIDAIDKLLK